MLRFTGTIERGSADVVTIRCVFGLLVAGRQHYQKEQCMSLNNTTKHSSDDEEMLPEYDLSTKQGVRGKYYRAYREGHTVTVHHHDGT